MRIDREIGTVTSVSREEAGEEELRRPWVADVGGPLWLLGVAMLVVAGLASVSLFLGVHPHDRGQRLVVALLACGVVILLRRWPRTLLLLATTATAFEIGFGNASVPFGIMIGVATYFVASRLPRESSIPAACLAGFGLGIALLLAAIEWRQPPLGVGAVEGFLPLIAAWFVGDSVATRRRYLAGLQVQAERERRAEVDRAHQEVREERVRIARELHDVVAHSLAVITVQAGVGRRLMAKRPQEAEHALESISEIGRTAQAELQVVLGLLREESPGAESLNPAPGIADLKELVAVVSAAGIPTALETSGDAQRLSPALELSLYRIVQEALTNVVKHAPGSRAQVEVDIAEREIRVEVANSSPSTPPGSNGSVPSRKAIVAGHGIIGMRERVAAFGGSLVAEPVGAADFHVVARVPIGPPS
jgi:signal transduction histidine kinase